MVDVVVGCALNFDACVSVFVVRPRPCEDDAAVGEAIVVDFVVVAAAEKPNHPRRVTMNPVVAAGVG